MSRNPRQTLIDMHTYCRPMGSKTERQFITRYLQPLGLQRDAYGNWYGRIGTAPVLWSCHTDTVHRSDGWQRVRIDAEDFLLLPADSRSNCLGADDTVGVWICRELWLRQVPGLYVFHYGEERGGQGSSKLARSGSTILDGIQYAVAFDRAGYTDIVTHQFGGRTCSDTFAASLGAQLASIDPQLGYVGEHGIYTDTAEYADLIPECTNLSVGYHRQHGRDECVYLPFPLQLLEAVAQLDVASLTIERKPGDDDRWSQLGADWPPYDYTLPRATRTPVSRLELSWDDDLCNDCGQPLLDEERETLALRCRPCQLERDGYLSAVYADVQANLRTIIDTKRYATVDGKDTER